MNTPVECHGDLEKLLIWHRDKYFPHIKSMAAYVLEMARQRASEDNKKDQGE